jgi:hypothetical protein
MIESSNVLGGWTMHPRALMGHSSVIGPVAVLFAGCSSNAEGDAQGYLAAMRHFSDAHHTFAAVSAVAEDVRLARVFVVRPHTGAVSVIGGDGEIAAELGRKGPGPGEFLQPSQVGVLDSFVWVTDPRRGRVSLFDRNSLIYVRDYVGAADIAGLTQQLGPVAPVALLRDGRVLLSGRGVGTYISGALYRVLAAARPPFVEIDTLAWVSSDAGVTPITIPGANRAFLYVQHPISDAPITITSQSGRVFSVRRPAPQRGSRNVFTVLEMNGPSDSIYSAITYRPLRMPRQLRTRRFSDSQSRFDDDVSEFHLLRPVTSSRIPFRCRATILQ